MSEAYGFDQLEAALIGVKEKAGRPHSQDSKPLAPRVRKPRSDLPATEYVNQEASFRLGDWVPRVFPGAVKSANGFRVPPDALGRTQCEEDLSITTNGTCDFAAQWDDKPAPGYTPIGLVAKFCPDFDKDGEPILTDDFDDEGNPNPNGSDDNKAARWLASTLGMDLDQLKREDLERDFEAPPFTPADFSNVTEQQVLARIADLKILKYSYPETYTEIRDWLDTLSIIEGVKLDALCDAAHSNGTINKRYKFVLLGDAATAPEPFDYVEYLFCDGQMSVVVGPPNVGKSYFILDCAFHVALGKPWLGKEVEPGLVVIIASEGAGGMGRRVKAQLNRHGVSDPNSIPLAIIADTINFRDERSIETLIETLREIQAHFGIPLRWVIVDTLSRALAGGNENAPDDMGALVRGADRVRTATGAHLTLIHHTGKDDTRGARGHSLLKAAVDTELAITRVEGASGAISVNVTKQRDLEIGRPFAFRLVGVEMGTNRRGKPVTSCVVEGAVIKPELTEAEREATQILETMLFESDAPHVNLAAWREAIMSRPGLLTGQSGDTNKKQWQRLRKSLEKKGMIVVSGDQVWTKNA